MTKSHASLWDIIRAYGQKTKTVGSDIDGFGKVDIGSRVSTSKTGSKFNDPQASLLGGLIGQEYVGTKKQVRNGLALGADQIMQADFERQLNRASYSDAVQGMEEAGLNSALLYGQASNPATVEADPSQMQSQSEELAPLQSAIGMLDSLSSIATSSASLKIQKDQVDAQNELARSNARLARAQAEKTKEDQRGAKLNNDFFDETHDLNLQLKRGFADKATYDAHIAQVQDYLATNSAEFQLDTMHWKSVSAEYQATIDGLEAGKRAEVLQAQYDLCLANAVLARANATRSYAEAKVARKSLEEIEARCLKLGEETGLLKGERNWQATEQFLSYMATAGAFLKDVTGSESTAINSSATAAGAGFSSSVLQSLTGEVEGLNGIYGAVLNTIRDRWKDSGNYSAKGGDDKEYKQIEPKQQKKTSSPAIGSPQWYRNRKDDLTSGHFLRRLDYWLYSDDPSYVFTDIFTRRKK